MTQDSVSHMTPNSIECLEDTDGAGDFMSFREFLLAMSAASDDGGPVPLQIDKHFLAEFAYGHTQWDPFSWEEVETFVRKSAPHLVAAARNCWEMFESENDLGYIWMLIAYLNVSRLQSEMKNIYRLLVEFTKQLPAELYTSMLKELLTESRERDKFEGRKRRAFKQ
jgi:hypothetical protein